MENNFEIAKVDNLPNPHDLAQAFLDKLDSGEMSPLKLKAIMVIFDQAGEAIKESLNEAAIREFHKVKDGKSYKGIESIGGTVTLASRSTKSYDACNDPILEDLLKQQKEIDAAVKARKKFLDAIEGSVDIRIDDELITVYKSLIKITESLSFSWR